MNEVFEQQWKPLKPLASNNIKEHGLQQVARQKALGMRWVETAPKSMKNLLVVDVDRADAAYHVKCLMEAEKVPVANFVTVNPDSDHAQVGWFIDGFAKTSRARSYFEAVRTGLTLTVGGDLGYGGRTMRNPTHDLQFTLWRDLSPYKMSTMKEFAQKANTAKRLAQPRTEATGGRNTDTFDAVRTWAYKNFKNYRYGDDFRWAEAVEDYACEINASWSSPMSNSEVRSIANSIASWVENNFSSSEFSDLQSFRARQRWGTQASDKAAQVLAMLDAGFSVREVGEALGVSYEAAKKAVQRARKTVSNQNISR